MSYVLTSSNDFNNTVAHIVKGLNSAGFSDKDYRIGESAKPQIPEQAAEQITLPDPQGTSKPESAEDDFSGLDGKLIGAELERRREQAQMPEIARKPTPCWTLPQRSKGHIQMLSNRPAMTR